MAESFPSGVLGTDEGTAAAARGKEPIDFARRWPGGHDTRCRRLVGTGVLASTSETSTVAAACEVESAAAAGLRTYNGDDGRTTLSSSCPLPFGGGWSNKLFVPLRHGVAITREPTAAADAGRGVASTAIPIEPPRPPLLPTCVGRSSDDGGTADIMLDCGTEFGSTPSVFARACCCCCCCCEPKASLKRGFAGVALTWTAGWPSP